MQSAIKNTNDFNNINNSITVNPYPLVTKKLVSELFKNSIIEVNHEERSVFAELEHSNFYILCGRLELDTDHQEIQIFYGELGVEEIEITDETAKTEVANYLYQYATNEINNSDSGFTINDQIHAESLIHNA